MAQCQGRYYTNLHKTNNFCLPLIMLAFCTIRSLTINLQQSSMGIACGCSRWLLSSTGKGAVCDVTGSNTCKEYQYTRHGSLIFGVSTRQKSRWERSQLPQIHKPLISHSLTHCVLTFVSNRSGSSFRFTLSSVDGAVAASTSYRNNTCTYM